MAHLLDFENADSAKAKALAALACSRAKASNAKAWDWADDAAANAVEMGIPNARDLLGNGRRPDVDALEKRINAHK